jgi:hypothetical protein
MDHKKPVVSRRDFLKRSAVVGVGATAVAGQDRKETKPGQFILTAWPMLSLPVRGPRGSRCNHGAHGGRVGDRTTISADAADEYL